MANSKKSLFIFLLTLTILLCACGTKKYKTDIAESGGIYMEYQISKDDFTYEDEYEDELQRMAYLIQNRLNMKVIAEVYVDKEKICIEISKEQDPTKFENLIEKEAKIFFIPEYDDAGIVNFTGVDETLALTKSIEELLEDGSIKMTNEEISSAGVGTIRDSNGNQQIVISLGLNANGQAIFKEMTQKAFDNGNERIAIVFDDEILSAPRVQSVISSGNAQITYQGDLQGANDVVALINIGLLKHKLTQTECVVFERKKIKK